jgi:hypothetical protein
MKNIPPSDLPKFHGLSREDMDSLFFEFDVLCRRNDYTFNDQKLKFFSATLKGATLLWFMGLRGNNIQTWEDTKKAFLKKYQDYGKASDLRDEVFQMMNKGDEISEDYVERFKYNL